MLKITDKTSIPICEIEMSAVRAQGADGVRKSRALPQRETPSIS